MSIRTQFEAYLLTERRVAHNTFCAYQKDIQQCVDFLAQHNIELEKASSDHIKQFLAFLKGHGISPRSMARKISSLKLFFAYAHDHFGIENCVKELAAPKIDQKLPQFLSQEEVAGLLEQAEKDKTSLGYRNMVMLYLLYGTGMRITELISLKIGDIYFDTGLIKISGKGGRERLVPLPRPMLDLLKKYIKKELVPEHETIKKSEYLFVCNYGGKIKPITRQAFWIFLKALCKKVGIARTVSPHTLRHSLATHMLRSGTDVRSLQLILGHENVTTVQIYTHVEVSHLRDVYNKKHPRSE